MYYNFGIHAQDMVLWCYELKCLRGLFFFTFERSQNMTVTFQIKKYIIPCLLYFENTNYMPQNMFVSKCNTIFNEQNIVKWNGMTYNCFIISCTLRGKIWSFWKRSSLIASKMRNNWIVDSRNLCYFDQIAIQIWIRLVQSSNISSKGDSGFKIWYNNEVADLEFEGKRAWRFSPVQMIRSCIFNSWRSENWRLNRQEKNFSIFPPSVDFKSKTLDHERANSHLSKNRKHV